MESDQNTNTVQNTAGASTVANVSSASSTPLAASDATMKSSKAGGDVVFQDKPKKNMGVILTIVLLALLAAGGIGFGVWAMMDGNSQVAKKDEQIAGLRGQLAEKSEAVDYEVVSDNDQGIGLSENPVIKAALPTRYTIRHSIPVVSAESPNGATMTFSSTDGGNLTCRFPDATGIGGCTVDGVPEGIYKIMTLHEGNGIGSEKVGFLMKDGTVWFAPIYNNGDANIGVNTNLQAKKVNIDGFIKDIVEISVESDVNEPTGGSGFSTVFVMSDNSLIEYDDSLFSE